MRWLIIILFALLLIGCGDIARSDRQVQSDPGVVGNGTVRLRTGPVHSALGLTQQSIGGDRFLVHHTPEQLLVSDQNTHTDVYFHDLETHRCEQISRAHGTYPNGASSWATISRDGNLVAFESTASNLVPGDTNGHKDVFLFNRRTGKTLLISRGLGGAQSNGESYDAQIAPDGNVVVFASRSTNLVPGDTNGFADVFLYDVANRSLIRINVDPLGGEVVGSDSDQPTLFPDGKWVVYVSSGSNLPGANGVPQLYVTRPSNGKLFHVTKNLSGESANGTCSAPTFGGRTHLSFTSEATNLAPDDSNGVSDVFLMDKITQEIRLASRDDGGTPLAGTSRDSVLSADGTKLAFVTETGGSAHDFGVAPRVVLRDLATETNTIVSEPGEFSDGVGLTASGSKVVFGAITSHTTSPDAAEAGLFFHDAAAPGVQTLACQTCDFPEAWPGLKTLTFTYGWDADEDNPDALEVHDLNKDGHKDLLFISSVNGDSNIHQVSVKFADGAGGYLDALNIPLNTAVEDMASGDLNGDGWLDLIIAGRRGSGRPDAIYLLLGNSSGFFEAPTVTETNGPPTKLLIADFNNDGKPDVAVRIASSFLKLFVGDGAGGFSHLNTYTFSGSIATFWAGHLNDDSLTDLIAVESNTGMASVYLGLGGGAFGPPLQSIVGGNEPWVTPFPNTVWIDVADFNGDGKLDVAACNRDDHTDRHAISLALGDGSGLFSPPQVFPSDRDNPSQCYAGDYDGDGKADLMVKCGESVLLLIGDGAGGFKATRHFEDRAVVRSIALADVDGDGHIDLATSGINWISPGSDRNSILLGDGAGHFGPPQYDVQQGAVSVVLGDVNGDGHLDAATANSQTNSVSVILGTGSGEFEGAAHFPVGDEPVQVKLDDFDCDGRLDLMSVNRSGNSLSLLRGNGVGGFEPAVHVAVGQLPLSMDVGDLNGDGIPDVVVANRGSDLISVLLGDGSGGFSSAAEVTGTWPGSVKLGDLDGDRHLDLIVGSLGAHTVELWFGDGTGGFDDSFVNIVGMAQPSELEVVDGDNDGSLDIGLVSDFDFLWRLIDPGDLISGSQQFGGLSAPATALEPADMDGDGFQDWATCSGRGVLAVANGTATGWLRAGDSPDFPGQDSLQLYHTGVGGQDIAIGDLDGDGDLDLVMATGDDTLCVVKNLACP